MQHQGGKSHGHNGVVNAKATLDLIIVDVPESLHVPIVSSLADADIDADVRSWNKSAESFLEAVFVFAEDYLQDDGAIIVIHPF
jgi:hypothetical protein